MNTLFQRLAAQRLRLCAGGITTNSHNLWGSWKPSQSLILPFHEQSKGNNWIESWTVVNEQHSYSLFLIHVAECDVQDVVDGVLYWSVGTVGKLKWVCGYMDDDRWCDEVFNETLKILHVSWHESSFFFYSGTIVDLLKEVGTTARDLLKTEVEIPVCWSVVPCTRHALQWWWHHHALLTTAVTSCMANISMISLSKEHISYAESMPWWIWFLGPWLCAVHATFRVCLPGGATPCAPGTWVLCPLQHPVGHM